MHEEFNTDVLLPPAGITHVVVVVSIVFIIFLLAFPVIVYYGTIIYDWVDWWWTYWGVPLP